MQGDFHYYATYCAALLAGYSPEESQDICYAAQLPDWFSVTFLARLNAPREAATTQLQLELIDVNTDRIGLQDVTRIWSSFHFLPYDLEADPGKGGKAYRQVYQLICKPNGKLVCDTVELARGKGLEAAGLAMHVLADTWAHQNFVGTPSLAINNTTTHFYELMGEGEGAERRRVEFSHNPSATDDLERGVYVNSVYQPEEHSIMNLGHGRAGHLPDYSFARYVYLPAWADYEEFVKDNPSDYWHAFCQMVYALSCLRTGESFQLNCYAEDDVADVQESVREIIAKRQLDASDDWRDLGEQISGLALDPFDLETHRAEYVAAALDARDDTYLGRFIQAAIAQKSMVTNRIYRSGSRLAGLSIEQTENDSRWKRLFGRLLPSHEEVGHD